MGQERPKPARRRQYLGQLLQSMRASCQKCKVDITLNFKLLKLNKNIADDVVYSKIDELSATEKEAYKSAAFTFENLPISPPSKDLCF